MLPTHNRYSPHPSLGFKKQHQRADSGHLKPHHNLHLHLPRISPTSTISQGCSTKTLHASKPKAVYSKPDTTVENRTAMSEQEVTGSTDRKSHNIGNDSLADRPIHASNESSTTSAKGSRTALTARTGKYPNPQAFNDAALRRLESASKKKKVGGSKIAMVNSEVAVDIAKQLRAILEAI